MTCKGERQDPETKTRREIKTKVGGEILDILKFLGFSEVRKILKERDIYGWGRLKICLDRVQGLGEFLEVEGTDWEDTEKIFGLLERLSIPRERLIRKSYLEMLEEC